MSKTEYIKRYEEIRKHIDRRIERNLPNLSPTNNAIAYLGIACADCGEIFDFPTKLNKLNDQDSLGIQWARTNAVSQISRHFTETKHWGSAYRINKNVISYDD